jgi:hypothetical protein
MPMARFPRRNVVLPILALAAGVAPPSLRADPPLRIELSRLEPREGGACRVWLVLENPAAEAFDPLRLDLVLFGADGVVARRVAVDVGPLPAGRTQARIFDLAGQGCQAIGSVLLNDVLACNGSDPARRAACADRAVPASRVDGVAFRK